MYWRVAITAADNLIDHVSFPHVIDLDTALQYSTGGLTEFAGSEVTVTTRPESVAELILNALPGTAPTDDDPAYVSWFAELMRLVEQFQLPPIAYADYFDASAGWEIGGGGGVRHARPPEPATIAPRRSAPMPSLPSTSIPDDTANALYRLETILQKATGFPRKPALWKERLSRGETRCCPASQSNSPPITSAVPTAQLFFFDDKYVHLGVWPAELQPHYTYMYSDPARVDALLELNNRDGFTVEPNFQLAHRFAQPRQRWFPTRLLSVEDYLRQWVDDFHDGRAGGRTREEIADPGFFQWLAERRYASAAEEESLHQWLDSKKAGIQIHVRPGIQILRTWSYGEAFAIEGQNEFAAQVRDAANQILIALGQAQLDSTS